MRESNALYVMVLAFLTAALSGCVSIDFKEPISAYAGTMTKSNTSLRQYYTQLNSHERDLYLKRAYYNPKMEIALNNANNLPSGLTPLFSAEGMEARLNALKLLTAYSERLTELTGSETPAKYSTNMQALGVKLQNLDKDFQALEGKEDPTASKYIAPVTAILGAVGDMYLTKKRDAALRAGIDSGSTAIVAIFDLLESDMIQIVQPLQDTGTSAHLAMAIQSYNEHIDCIPLGDVKAKKDKEKRTCLTPAERLNALNEIGVLAERRESLIVNQPVQLVAAMREAHAELLKFAREPKNPQGLAALEAALDLFNDRVEPIAKAIAAMEES